MEAFVKTLTDALREQFPGADPQLEPVRGNGRVWGFLVWDGFEPLDVVDRQEKLWQFLRSRLTPDEQHRVSAILTMTNDEMRDD